MERHAALADAHVGKHIILRHSGALSGFSRRIVGQGCSLQHQERKKGALAWGPHPTLSLVAVREIPLPSPLAQFAVGPEGSSVVPVPPSASLSSALNTLRVRMAHTLRRGLHSRCTPLLPALPLRLGGVSPAIDFQTYSCLAFNAGSFFWVLDFTSAPNIHKYPYPPHAGELLNL